MRPGDNSKVFGMQEGQGDFITNRYRVDIQYTRDHRGGPPNAITWRVLYGSRRRPGRPVRARHGQTLRLHLSVEPVDGLSLEGDVGGSDFRLTVNEGGVNGPTLYDYGRPTPRGAYTPSPHYAYLGAPVGRSGAEAASIANTIYRNVWLANRPRPQTLGSAVR